MTDMKLNIVFKLIELQKIIKWKAKRKEKTQLKPFIE